MVRNNWNVKCRHGGWQYSTWTFGPWTKNYWSVWLTHNGVVIQTTRNSHQVSTLKFVRYQWKLTSDKSILHYGCPTGQVKKSDSQTCQYDGQIYSHWYKILGLLYKRALFDIQFVHNLFWLKLKWNARSKLFYLHMIYRYSMLWWSSRTLTKLKSQSQKHFKERKYQYLEYKNKYHSGTDT